MSDFKEILSEAKKQIKEVSVHDVQENLNPAKGFTLLDVREGDEWEQGHLDKAIFLPRGFLEVKADKILTDKSEPIVVYCAGGIVGPSLGGLAMDSWTPNGLLVFLSCAPLLLGAGRLPWLRRLAR